MISKAGVASPFSAGAVIAKRYRLRELLGEGTSGVVWVAEDTTTGDDVALKLVVHPEPESRVHILRDAQACCAIVHDNVVRVLDVGETGSGDPFLVMELLSGETLAQRLVRGRKLGQREVAAIGRDVARALAAAHAQGVVHRNLKPANVFLHDARWEIVPVVKVLDFALGDDVVASSPTVDDSGVLGSIHMSPEQLLGDEVVDGRTDIWSLGVILYELCTGAPLFDGRAVEAVRKMWAADIPSLDQKVRTVDSAFSRLVMACLRRSREERPSSAAALAEALESFSGPPERPSMATLAELRASLLPPSLLTAPPPAGALRATAPPACDPTLVRPAAPRPDSDTLPTGTAPPLDGDTLRQAPPPRPDSDTLPAGMAPRLDGDTLRQARAPSDDGDATLVKATLPAHADVAVPARNTVLPPGGDATLVNAATAAADNDPTLLRVKGASPANDRVYAVVVPGNIDGHRVTPEPRAATLDKGPTRARRPAPRLDDKPTLPSAQAPRIDDDPTRISTPSAFQRKRLSDPVVAKKPAPRGLAATLPALVKGRGRLSARAALSAAAGALVLSMLGVTALIVVTSRGCGGAQSAPATCGARCAQRAP